jgi:uncharacterized membrane protein YqjE
MADLDRREQDLREGVDPNPRVYNNPAADGPAPLPPRSTPESRSSGYTETGGTRMSGATSYTTYSATAEPSVGELVSSLSEDFTTLVRQEIKLAKVEMQESAAKATRNVAMMAAGGFVAYAGVILVLIALAILIGNAINSLWLGSLIVGIVVIVLGAILLSSGLSGLKNVSMTPEKTIETIKDDARFVKEKVA